MICTVLCYHVACVYGTTIVSLEYGIALNRAVLYSGLQRLGKYMAPLTLMLCKKVEVLFYFFKSDFACVLLYTFEKAHF